MSRKFLGGIGPVVQRELREGSRRPVNHWLRVGSAAAGTLLLCALVFHSRDSAAQLGGRLFAGLHSLLLVLICLIVPSLAADSIAREKRDGTLGLLFLTPLTAGGIVTGKALTLSLRVFTLWLAIVPVLAIPFLTGGVGWFDAFTAVDLQFCTAVLCLAAGLLASSLAQNRNAALTLALFFGVAFVFLFACSLFIWLVFQFRGPAVFAMFFEGREWLGEVMMGFTGFWSNQAAGWSPIIARTAVRRVWINVLLEAPALSLLFWYFVIRFAARRIDRSWQDNVPSLRRQKWNRRFTTPLFRKWFSRRMRRALDHNPIAWLQQYSWRAGVAKWGLCLAVLVLECLLMHGDWPRIEDDQIRLFLALAAIATFVGVGSFLQEKRSGALELILITPLPVNAIIFGRASGMWKQFLPSVFLVWGGFWLSAWNMNHQNFYYSSPLVNSSWADFRVISSLVIGAFFALPVFATYSALRVKNLFGAAFLTWVGLVIASAFGSLMIGTLHIMGLIDDPSDLQFCLGILIGNLAFALLACFLLRHSLSRRIYSF